jgi:hypothetical protein
MVKPSRLPPVAYAGNTVATRCLGWLTLGTSLGASLATADLMVPVFPGCHEVSFKLRVACRATLFRQQKAGFYSPRTVGCGPEMVDGAARLLAQTSPGKAQTANNTITSRSTSGPDVMAPLPGSSVAQHPLRLDLLLLASWPHARFHPCRCSPDNPACWKGWRDSVCFALGSIITVVI